MWRTLVAVVSITVILGSITAILIIRGAFRERVDGEWVHAEQSAPRFAAIKVCELVNGATIRESLQTGEWFDPNGLLEESTRSLLLNALAEFISMYYVEAESAYGDWRASSGHSVRTREEMIEHSLIEESYEYTNGSSLPSNLAMSELFDLFRHDAISFGNGANQAVAIACEPDGVVFVAKRLSDADRTFPMLQQRLSIDEWHGRHSMGCRRWWLPPRRLQDTLTEAGATIGVTAGVVLAYRDGTRRPLHFKFYLEPGFPRWTLESTSISNYVGKDVRPLDF